MPAHLSTSLAAQGFHFTLSTRLSSAATTANANCTLHLLHVLPPDVYADRYEPALAGATLVGPADVEAPVGAVAGGSVLLLEVAKGEGEGDGEAVVEVPLHARYGRPRAAGGYHAIRLAPPLGFWACPRPAPPPPLRDDTALPPALAAHVPNGLFRDAAVHTVPHADAALEVVIPVGRLADLALVDVGTAAVVLLCFAYLAAAAVRTARRLGAAPRARKAE